MTEVTERRSTAASCSAIASTDGSKRVVKGFFVVFAMRLALGSKKAYQKARAMHLQSTCGDRPECVNTLFGLTTPKLLRARIMADSDNTTTLPLVTYRRAPARTAAAMTGSPPGTIACIDLGRDQTTDPAVAAWREWQAAHEETDRLSREQQRLERKLV